MIGEGRERGRGKRAERRTEGGKTACWGVVGGDILVLVMNMVRNIFDTRTRCSDFFV